MPNLNWIAKDKVVNYHQQVKYRVLKRKYGFNSEAPDSLKPSGSGNMIIHGDNLEALKSLLPEFEGKVDCIYIDPPYNTGEEKWVYNDNVNDPRIQKWLGEVVGKQGEDLSRHDKWLCMMYPRLVLLKKMMSYNGTIFISIDDNELSNLKCICDEIFGYNNFVGQWMWYKSATPPNLSHKIKKNIEYVLGYENHKDNVKYTGIKKNSPSNDPFTKPQNAIKTLTFKSKTINVSLPDGTIPAGTYGTEEYPNILVNDMIVKDGLNENDVKFCNKFIWEQDTLDRQIAEGTYIACSKQLVLSYKKAEYAPEVPPNLIDETVGVCTTEEAGKRQVEMFGETVFEYPKDISLIEYLINFKSGPSSLILDSFAGSGTTAHAVLDLNKKDGGSRRFILVELMDYADSITAKRVKLAATGYPYVGKQEVELYKKKITTGNLRYGNQWLEEADAVGGVFSSQYSKVTKKLKDGFLSVVGVLNMNERMEGLGGAFDYYELGETLFNEDGSINSRVSEEDIREYIYYSETKQHLSRERKDATKYLLDTFNATGYYFYHNNESQSILTLDTLNIVIEPAEQYIVYADACTLSEKEMTERHIIFKQIPQDIKRF